MKRATARWARPLGGAAVLGVVLWRLGGSGPGEAVRALDAGALALAAAVGAVTTLCAAWRWRLVAHALGADLSMTSAVGACYRAQFVNVAVPGGVLGDVERGVTHGRDVADVGRGVRTVAWERAAGQVVLAGSTAVVLLAGSRTVALPAASSTATFAAIAGVVVAVVVVAVAVLAVASPTGHRAARLRDRGGRAVRLVVTECRRLANVRTLLGVVTASLVVLAGHVATFLLAVSTVGVRMPLADLLPLTLLVLLVAGVPLNIAGWGLREGAAAWGFGAAGVGADRGLAVAVAYGALVLVATLPGAVLLLAGRSRWLTTSATATRRRAAAHGPTSPDRPEVRLHG